MRKWPPPYPPVAQDRVFFRSFSLVVPFEMQDSLQVLGCQGAPRPGRVAFEWQHAAAANDMGIRRLKASTDGECNKRREKGRRRPPVVSIASTAYAGWRRATFIRQPPSRHWRRASPPQRRSRIFATLARPSVVRRTGIKPDSAGSENTAWVGQREAASRNTSTSATSASRIVGTSFRALRPRIGRPLPRASEDRQGPTMQRQLRRAAASQPAPGIARGN